jgi:hypothetical protein
MDGGLVRCWAGMSVLAISLTACSHGDSFAGSTSCSWRPYTSTGEQFDDSAPHVCLLGGGTRHRLVASHLAVGSDLRVDLVAEPLGTTVALTVDADRTAETVVETGGQVPVTAVGDDGRPFSAWVTAAGGRISPG